MLIEDQEEKKQKSAKKASPVIPKLNMQKLNVNNDDMKNKMKKQLEK